MITRFYNSGDYQKLATLYKSSDQFDFDEVTDSEESLKRKINRDPHSVLVAIENEEIIGSVSIIEDGRIALLFRLVVSQEMENYSLIIEEIVNQACMILKERNYKEVHITAPDNQSAKNERLHLNFNEGKSYRWFWKKL